MLASITENRGLDVHAYRQQTKYMYIKQTVDMLYNAQ